MLTIEFVGGKKREWLPLPAGDRDGALFRGSATMTCTGLLGLATANQAWANIAALACNFVSLRQLTALPNGDQAKAWDIKRRKVGLAA